MNIQKWNIFVYIPCIRIIPCIPCNPFLLVSFIICNPCIRFIPCITPLFPVFHVVPVSPVFMPYIPCTPWTPCISVCPVFLLFSALPVLHVFHVILTEFPTVVKLRTYILTYLLTFHESCYYLEAYYFEFY